jgi:tRNA(Arg) A34 adenosine deaminase TadA
MSSWEALPRPWQACLEEAWTAYCAGSIPIGACVVDASGNILSRGRNRINETDGEAPFIFNDELAHAEINALLAIRSEYQVRHTAALYTTTEPCPLCMGAFYMSGIRRLHYAAREPWAGSVNLLGATPYLSRKPIQVFGPADPLLEALVTALYVAWELECSHNPQNLVLQAMRETIPAGVALGEQLYQDKVLRLMSANKQPAKQMFDTIMGLINR